MPLTAALAKQGLNRVNFKSFLRHPLFQFFIPIEHNVDFAGSCLSRFPSLKLGWFYHQKSFAVRMDVPRCSFTRTRYLAAAEKDVERGMGMNRQLNHNPTPSFPRKLICLCPSSCLVLRSDLHNILTYSNNCNPKNKD